MSSAKPDSPVDTSYLAAGSEPSYDAQRYFTLVYIDGEGSESRYDVTEREAWTFSGDAYELLSSSYSAYDGRGSCYFVERKMGA